MQLSQEEQWLLDEKYSGVPGEAFIADCQRLKAGEPLAYVIGWIPFLDCQIWLDSRPLIPRPETEYWTEQAIQRINASVATLPHSPRVLDLCAGSGCIGVAVAKAVPEARVDFSEIDPRLLPTIEENLMRNDISLKDCRVIESDMFDHISEPYDFILTNPPYIDPHLDRTETSVKEYEPHQALYGGKDGLECIFKIIAGAPKFLNQGGQLWIEHEPEQVELIRALATTRNFIIDTKSDQYNIPRFSVLTMQ